MNQKIRKTLLIVMIVIIAFGVAFPRHGGATHLEHSPLERTEGGIDSFTSAKNHIRSVPLTCDPPVIRSQPSSQTIYTNNTASLQVAVDYVGSITGYQWYVGTTGGGTPISGATGSSYTTPVLTNNQSYYVVITYRDRCDPFFTERSLISSTATITVKSCTGAPAITAQPQSQGISTNQSATLTVSANGQSPLSYQWYQGTNGITTNPVGSNSSSYSTPNLTATTSYWVRVSDPCKNMVGSSTAKITVDTSADSISTNPSLQQIIPGGTTEFVTNVSGSGFSNGATFSVSGLPSGATAIFSPATTTTNGSATMTVTTNYNTPVGLHLITITGKSGNTLQRSSNVFLFVNVRVSSRVDFDADGKSDPTVYRGYWWYVQRSSLGYWEKALGGALNDIPVPGDYDGDGKTDLAVYRGGWWYILGSSSGYMEKFYGGGTNDIPVPGDYNGDKKTDLAVYRGGSWLIQESSTGSEKFINLGGAANDIPVPGDYDGDGKTDAAVYRGYWWYVQRSSLGYWEKALGGALNDIPVPGDYDGDGKTDLAVYRGGWWLIQRSNAGYMEKSYGGAANDIPMPGDYDGDGKTDLAVYRGGWWWILQSKTGTERGINLGGAANDIPQ